MSISFYAIVTQKKPYKPLNLNTIILKKVSIILPNTVHIKLNSKEYWTFPHSTIKTYSKNGNAPGQKYNSYCHHVTRKMSCV